MADRVYLAAQERTWTVDVQADRAAIAGGGASAAFQPGPNGTVAVRRQGRDTPDVAVVWRDGPTVWVSLAGEVFEFHVGPPARRGAMGHDDALLTPPMSATVVRVAVGVGDSVAAGDLLVALEAMKMELPIRAPRAARVTAIHCHEGDLVQPGASLVSLD
jgi:3-methylcrotonyl-CoA carboxylase alpha subunit